MTGFGPGVVAGFLFGAALGPLLTVLLWHRLPGRPTLREAWARRPPADRPPAIRPTEFRLGPLRTDLVILDGDGEHVIREESVRVIANPIDVGLPAEVAQWRDEVHREQAQARRVGHRSCWNGLTYALEDLVIGRAGSDESPEVTIRFQHADYYTFLAAQQLDRQFADGSTPRRRYLQGRTPWEVPAFMRCSFGTNVAVVSADDQVVVCRRSMLVRSAPGRWSSSANEALSRSLDGRDRAAPNLYDVARRGVQEELSIQPDEYQLELLAFYADTNRSQWGCMFVAFLTSLTSADLRDRFTRGTGDRWEHDSIELVPFEPSALLQYLLRPDRIDNWSSVGPPLFYLALVRRYGRHRTEQVATQLIQRLAQGA